MEQVLNQRDLLLLPFPYSDLSGSKVRPVLVVSNDLFNTSQDLIVCCVTSNISKDFYTVLLDQHSLEQGTLHDICCVKVENIAKIEKSKVIKKIGRINKETFQKIVQKLHELFE
ncbi:type II toxin-antitoxin system PemK/MazF family toxin [Candidatus Woesearchaeota archaeon]|nr:type II toxin-antitoxin system PemK/MazF family toxin [Candidatus Woesearchaeota archaeon]